MKGETGTNRQEDMLEVEWVDWRKSSTYYQPRMEMLLARQHRLKCPASSRLLRLRASDLANSFPNYYCTSCHNARLPGFLVDVSPNLGLRPCLRVSRTFPVRDYSHNTLMGRDNL